MKYCIGDIHANIQALTELLTHLDLKQGDELIFLGDYIDKNTATEATVALLLELSSRYSCIFIKGNHDFVWEQYLLKEDTTRQNFLINYGGVEALSGYTSEGEKLIVNNDILKIKTYLHSYLKLISLMQDYYLVDDYIALHAGLLESQLTENPLVWQEINYFVRPGDMNIEKKYLDRYTLVAGHTFTTFDPVHTSAYINVDLGAAYSNYLGVFCIDTKTVIRSDGLLFKLM